jgi:hypothetical protein
VSRVRNRAVAIAGALSLLWSIGWLTRPKAERDVLTAPRASEPSIQAILAAKGDPKPDDFSSQSRSSQSFSPAHAVPVPPETEALAEFRDWFRDYRQASFAERIRSEAQGVRLSRHRRSALKELMARDPEQALRWAVSLSARREMPASIQTQLEEPVSAKGDLFVAGALPRPGRESAFQPIRREAVIDGRIYQAHTFGRRLNEPSRHDVSLHGFAIDGVLALSDSPMRVLAAGESPARAKLQATSACPISGKAVPAQFADGASLGAPFVESGDTVYRVCGSNHLPALAEQLAREENSFNLAAANPARNLGVKSVLVMIVDFPDRPGGNTTASNALQVLAAVGQFFLENSFQRMILEGVEPTPVLRMPRASSEYVAMGSPLQLLFDARGAAEAMGYAPTQFDFHLVSFTYIGFPWSGLGFIGERGAFAQDWLLSRVTVAHELGHNLGNWHAGSWEAADDAIVGPGTHVEYGNPFDLMGGSLSGHFNANFKFLLGWLPAESILSVTNDGTYRVHAIDVGGTLDPAKRYAIRIRGGAPQSGVPTDYWLDFRQQYTNNPWARNGAMLKWASDYAGGLNNHLLDTTPGTTQGAWDAPLVVGWTFSDRERGLHIAPLARAGFGSEAYLEVQITFGNPFNQPPTLTLEANGSQFSPGALVQFAAVASDPDNDVLSYGWDFDDGTLIESSLNQPFASKTWLVDGEYIVRCVASDRKGGQASASMIVRIGNPTSHRISGRVEALGSPVASVRVHNGLAGSEYRAAFTDAAGTFTLVGLSDANYTIGAVKPGFIFAPAFANPITLAAGNVSNLLIKAAPYGMPLITGFTPKIGGVGSVLNVNGFNFGSVSEVEMGRLAASYSLASPTQLFVTVPQGAITAPIRLISAAGIDTSVEAFAVTSSAPAVVSPPQSQTVVVRTTVSFSVLSSGSGPLSFQWRKDNQEIAGATNVTVTIVNVQTNQAGLYDVVLSNPIGVVTSEVAQLNVVYFPTLEEALDTANLVWEAGAAHPWTTQTGLNHDGQDAAMSGRLTSMADESWLQTTLVGPVELNFWWRRFAGSRFVCARTGAFGSQTLIDYDGVRTNWQYAALYLPEGTNIVRWTCRANAAIDDARIWLDEVRVKPIDDTVPRILEPPLPQTAAAGDTVKFQVRAAGYQPLSYQWFKVASPGLFTATNDTLTLSGIGTGDSGAYGVYVWNLLGGVFSPTALLTVNAAAPSAFHITRVEGAVVLTWNDPEQWLLEEAESLNGPWQPVQGAGGGSHSTPADLNQKFFRLRRQ